MLVPTISGRVKYLPLVPPPPGALEDFTQIVDASDLKKPVELGWTIDDTRDLYWPFDDGILRLLSVVKFRWRVSAFTIVPHPPERLHTRVVGSICGIDKMSRTLVMHGVPKEEARTIARRHVLAHEVGHVRQFERGDFPCGGCRAIREQEAEDWSYVVFGKLWPEHRPVQEFLSRRFHQASRFER